MVDGIGPRWPHPSPSKSGGSIDGPGGTVDLCGEVGGIAAQLFANLRPQFDGIEIGSSPLNRMKCFSYLKQGCHRSPFGLPCGEDRFLSDETRAFPIPFESVMAPQSSAATLEVKLLSGERLAFPDSVLLRGQQLREVGSRPGQKLGQPGQHLVEQRRWARDETSRKQRAERRQIVAGEGEAGADGAGGVTNLMPCIPQRIQDRSNRLFGRRPFVKEEQVDVGVQGKLRPAVSANRQDAELGVALR
jgi:hypothetical protein